MDLFPYDHPRSFQKELIGEVKKAIEGSGHLIAHAPTGLGKTVATLAPALSYAIRNNKTVVFLTSRHTQHIIVFETLKAIKKRFDITIESINFISRQKMCPMDHIQNMSSRDFIDFCKNLVADNKCPFFSKTKKSTNLSVDARLLINSLKVKQPLNSETIFKESKELGMCPYEIAINLAKNAKVIIGDYYYIFSPYIREPFLNKINKSLSDLVIIVDEAHNLSSRLRALMSTKLSTVIINRAKKEAKKFGYANYVTALEALENRLRKEAEQLNDGEEVVAKKGIIDKLDYDTLALNLESLGEEIRKMQRYSYVGSVGSFLIDYKGQDLGFVRILRKEDGEVFLSYNCLDPSILSEEVIRESHSTIFISGTLKPLEMYRDIFGFPEATKLVEYNSPFPEDNKKILINTETSTLYKERGPEMFRRISEISAKIVNTIKGNSIIFFPSYSLKNQIARYLIPLITKTIFEEDEGLSHKQRFEIIERFKGYKDTGSVLLAVTTGSFGEGIDLPGDLLKGVVVVGIPLQPPTLEVKALMNYYNLKFDKGRDYAYIIPAITKSLQNAGRAIRTEKDKGVIAFLDRRYAYQQYYKLLPDNSKIILSKDIEKEINSFFKL